MFKLLKNKKGQGMTVQYALTFFFTVAIVVGMTVYFKRAVQGRIRDATVYMVKTVRSAGGGNYIQYEPYYTETIANRSSDSTQRRNLYGSANFSSGVSEQIDSSRIGTKSVS